MLISRDFIDRMYVSGNALADDPEATTAGSAAARSPTELVCVLRRDSLLRDFMGETWA